MLNETIQQIPENATNKATELITKFSKFTTNSIINILSSNNIDVSSRWAGLLTLFISVGIILLALKISKPILKWAFIIIAIILFMGLLVPSW